jgi:hypothetical protein
MDATEVRWDNRSAEQWLEEAGRFEKMAERLDRNSHRSASFAALAPDAPRRPTETSNAARHLSSDSDWRRMCGSRVTPVSSSDADYYRRRAASEYKAADDAHDSRVRRVHLALAERYQALVRKGPGACVGLAS